MMHRFLPGLAQVQTEAFRTTELDLPESSTGLLLLVAGLALLCGVTIWTSLRDSRLLKTPWRVTLLLLRSVVLVLVLVVLLNPRQRTQTSRIQKSRVGILVDTSLSMAYPATENGTADNGSADGGTSDSRTSDGGSSDNAAAGTGTAVPAGEPVTRAEAVRAALVDSGLLKKLSETHAVSVYSFDSTLVGPRAIISDQQTSFVIDEENSESSVDQDGANGQISAGNRVARVDLAESGERSAEETVQTWQQILQPEGTETRLGESLHQLIGQLAGRTLAGLVVITDGRSNVGLDAEVARDRAERSETRLITIGVGSTRTQANLWVAGMQSPSDVHRGDPFDVSVVVQGSGMAQQSGLVRLYQQSGGSDGKDRRQIAEAAFELTDEGIPAEVSFQQQLNVPGKYEYVATAELQDGEIVELTLDDNQRRREVEVTDRKQKVLLISSGPMRDYRFVRNMLYRHSGIESDVWLQTISADDIGFVSQEAEKVLTEFPKTEAELFEYDVIVAFDANWALLSSDQQKFLNRWVDEHSGGIIFVAGELFTPELARDADRYRDIAVLYPVLLNRVLSELRVTQRADTAWPVLLTPEGRTTPFLKIADATGKSDVDLWKTFRGIYRSYPVRALRDGAVVLAEYGNPRARTQSGQPPFLATQFYGKGRTMFVSSAETWRLRAISPEGHQRFWTGMIREVGQGRRNRGRSRGLLLLDRTEVSPGQTVTIRAQVYNARLQPLQRESIPISIVDAEGRPVTVPNELRSDGARPGQFVNTFRPARQGAYRITVPVPESSDVLQAGLEVVLPNLESENPSQDVQLLTRLTQDTGGTYLLLSDAAAALPALLPDRSEPVIVDEQLKTLWDRQWLMYLMIGLLSLEWALRRVVRLS
ncbi:MAG: hypothetical protein RIK87_12445 [Fuerstiella sp.]